MWWSAWESVSEVDLEGGAGRCPGAVALPFGVGAHDREVDELGRGLFVGEVSAGLDRLADLAVQALDRVGGVDGAAQVLGQREERDHVLPGRAPGLDGRRVAVAPVSLEGVELGERGLGVGGGVDRPQRGGDPFLVAVVDVAQRGADEVHDAGLYPGLRERRLDRLRETLEPVDAGDQDVLDAAAAEVVQDGQPELRPLGLLPPDPEHLALTVTGHPEREIAGAVLHRAVLADADHHRVEVDDRVHLLERPGAPRGDVFEHRVGDPADRVAADLGAVELGQVIADVADGHAAGVEPEDLLVEAGQPRLALGQDLRLERALAVAGRLDLDRPQVALDRLGGVPVADVGALRDAARRVAEVLGDLGLQRRLDDPAGPLREQPARARELLGPQAAHSVIQRAVGQQTREAVDDLLRRLRPVGLGAPPILHGAHGDGWPLLRAARRGRITTTTHTSSDRTLAPGSDGAAHRPRNGGPDPARCRQNARARGPAGT